MLILQHIIMNQMTGYMNLQYLSINLAYIYVAAPFYKNGINSDTQQVYIMIINKILYVIY